MKKPRNAPCGASPLAALLAALSFVALLGGETAPARAETSPWVENEGGRMRLVALPPDAGGSVRGAIEIEPKPGWITYWREPGESGIPPQVSISGGAALGSLSYPVPKVLSLGSVTDVGYDAPVALPLTLQSVTGPAKVDVFIGLCKQICIPFQASFPLGLAVTAARPDEVQRIDAAHARVPTADPALQVRRARLKDRKLLLDVTLPAEETAVEAIVTGPAGGVFLAAAKPASPGSATLTVPLTTLDPARDPRSIDWTVLLKAGTRASEAKITVE